MNLKRISAVVGIIYSLLFSTAVSQISKVGPIPPPGTDRGITTSSKSQIIIPEVPAYLWQHGCGPTAVGMVVGYYDGHGLPDLVIGDASTQTSEVNAMIATDHDNPLCGGPYSDHYQDYSCPIDYDYVIPDRSETGDAHSDNCVADFHLTSRSSIGMMYGWSFWEDAPAAFVDYCNYANPNYNVEAHNIPFSEFTWEDYKSEIDNDFPVTLLVDSDADGTTDHFVTGIGYDESTMKYGIYDTWDYDIHWYDWEQMWPGVPFGIFGVTTYRCATAVGDTLHVPAEYATIQDGINAAEAGDVVLVADGVYTGPGFRDISFGTKMIHVVSENGPENTIIDCQGDWQDNHRAFSIINNITTFASIRGFTIRGGVSTGGGAAIYLNNSSIRIMNCIVTGNSAENRAAIYCISSSPIITNCTISLNEGSGIYIDAWSFPTIKNSIIWENIPNEMVAENMNAAIVSYCDIYGGWPGATNSLTSTPLFVDPGNGDFNIFENSPCIDSGDVSDSDPDGSRADIGVYYSNHPAYYDAGGIIYVSESGDDELGDGSMGNPFATIQHGLRASRHGDTVIVENGIYHENIKFYGHNAYLSSRYYYTENINDVLLTVIDGQDLGNVVIFNSGEDYKAAVSGFTIQNGNALNGGGIYCAYSEPSLINNIITDNRAEQYGGGIYSLFAAPLIKGNLLYANMATGEFGFGGGIYAAYGAPNIVNCTSSGNSASIIGGSVYSYSSDMSIVNSISWGNECIYRPEIYISGGNALVTFCDVESGQAGTGNIDSDPMFCGAGDIDFTIDSDSPCMHGGLNGCIMGAFGPGCGDPVPVLSIDPYEITTTNPIEPGLEEHFIIRLKNMGNAVLPVDGITCIESSGPVSGWLGLDNYPPSMLSIDYPENSFDLDVVLNMGGMVDIPYVPATLEGYLLISWLGNETRVDISVEIGAGEFICDCTPGESNESSPIDILDIIHLIRYKFLECPPGAGPGSCPPPAPYPVCSGDVNCDCSMDIYDIVYLIDYKFRECSPDSRVGTCPSPCSCEEWVIKCGSPIY